MFGTQEGQIDKQKEKIKDKDAIMGQVDVPKVPYQVATIRSNVVIYIFIINILKCNSKYDKNEYLRDHSKPNKI